MTSISKSLSSLFKSSTDDIAGSALKAGTKVDDVALLGAKAGTKVDDIVNAGNAKSIFGKYTPKQLATGALGGAVGVTFLSNMFSRPNASAGQNAGQAVNSVGGAVGGTVGGLIGSVFKGVLGLPEDSSIVADYGQYISSSSFLSSVIIMVLSFFMLLFKLL